jgi:predicted transposase/invertase (TIGR01784 family)
MGTAEKYINPFTNFGFSEDEIAKFSPDDKVKYEASLKYYRDLKNVVDTSYEEGKAEGIAEGEIKSKIEIARQMKSDSEPVEKIMRYTGLSAQDIENI